ncbi:phospholipid carrier-dependent glycosyltransferase [Streptosporangiaceae bacterium NEAU-GS5]|nr:phospholipid carrier-dependent glycosyltransferase [Streptosporangiaceae bacterium NEAU-GS5]
MRVPFALSRAFLVLLAVSTLLRAVTMLAYRPPQLYWYDSFDYLNTAVTMRPGSGFHPGGYPLLLWLLRPFHSVTVVAVVQHALGLATGVLIYAVVVRRGRPRWAGTLAAAPVLLDASFLRLEHAILSDTLFIALVVAGVAAALWHERPTVWDAALLGAALAGAGLTRTVALPLLALALVWLAGRRVGGRALLAFGLAAVVPLVAYASWAGASTGSDGVALWARTMTFADCSIIRPPAAEARLCPNGTWQDAASEYVWDPRSPINRLPGGQKAGNGLARSFALHAIAAQPFDYLRAVVADTALTFAWTPVPHPRRVNPAFGFARGAWPLPSHPLIDRAREAYDPAIRGPASVDPYAGFLIAYQYPAYLRGPFIAAILLLGGIGAVRRRGAALPWLAATALLVVPVAVLDFDHRYVLPVIPLACLAAAMAVNRSEKPFGETMRSASRFNLRKRKSRSHGLVAVPYWNSRRLL